MNRVTRNRLLIWIIFVGLANFVSYTMVYWCIGGDAKNGVIRNGVHYIRGHHLQAHAGEFGREAPVSRRVWIYSYIHSISIWPTIAAVLVSMFILARPHIIATMKQDAMIRGTTFVTVGITVVVLVTGASTLYFILDFFRALEIIGSEGTLGTWILGCGGGSHPFIP
ncbi:MAG: hypothetical protein KAV82_01895 [Phycisphaerae bacterium]|nr:hypothetical protein [Phycisphaerae bacterium]